MSEWDPFKIIAKHKEIKKLIEAGKPGYAQTDIGEQTVSYVNTDHPGYYIYGFRPVNSRGEAYDRAALFEEFLLDIAAGDRGAIASPSTFSRDRAEFLVKDKRAFPKKWVKIHQQADMIAKLLNERPELFS